MNTQDTGEHISTDVGLSAMQIQARNLIKRYRLAVLLRIGAIGMSEIPNETIGMNEIEKILESSVQKLIVILSQAEPSDREILRICIHQEINQGSAFGRCHEGGVMTKDYTQEKIAYASTLYFMMHYFLETVESLFTGKIPTTRVEFL